MFAELCPVYDKNQQDFNNKMCFRDELISRNISEYVMNVTIITKYMILASKSRSVKFCFFCVVYWI